MQAESRTSRILLREFTEADRAPFIHYQTDPRYRRLYDFEDEHERPNQLFDLFLKWQRDVPRLNVQLAIVDSKSRRLIGCGGIRRADGRSAVLGIELAPSEWGRFRLAIDAAIGLLNYGFDEMKLATVYGDTASGNRRIEKLARWFGAELVKRRDGPPWMKARGWHEVDWSLGRKQWLLTKARLVSRIHEATAFSPR